MSVLWWRFVALIAVVAPLLLVSIQGGNAQTPYCWIDAKTGQPVPVGPACGMTYIPGVTGPTGLAFPRTTVNDVQVNPLNPNQAGNSKTGQNFVRQPDGSW